MKDFVSRLQKDLAQLQKTIQQESDDLLKKVKTAATKDNIIAKGKEIEKLMETKLKRFEPQLNKFMEDVRKNAKKAGIDIDTIGQQVRSKIKTAGKKAKTSTSSAGHTTSKRAGGGTKKAATTKAATKTTSAKAKTATAKEKQAAPTAVATAPAETSAEILA